MEHTKYYCKECNWSGMNDELDEGIDERPDGMLYSYGICPKCHAPIDYFYKPNKE